MRIFHGLLIFILSFFLFASDIIAGGFAITSIGEMDLQGTAYPQYWYTGTNVVIAGTGPVSTTVDLTIDGVSNSLTTDATGNWSHSAALTEGDHTLSLSAASTASYTFTLTIGEPPTDVGSISAPATPAAGFGYPTLIMLVSGVGLFISAVFLIGKNSKAII